LQEFDLPPGEVVIGRSPDCHITIEDPLISRQHAKIVVSDRSCTFIDLQSRNGSRLNGRPAREPVELHDTDRIRIGAQELVFFEMSTEKRSTRATGAMRLCSHCGSPFAEGTEVCPHCGATVGKDEDTMSGVVVEPRRTWVLDLVGEVLERAIAAGKTQEASRMLHRAADEFSERARNGGAVDAKALAQISDHALRLAAIDHDLQWVQWVVDSHQTLKLVPSAALVPAFSAAANEAVARGVIVAFAASLRSRESELTSAETAIVASLENLDRSR
jgi:FHA domain